MFDILKIQKKKIVSNAVNLMPIYRSYISYNWTTTFDGSGNRQLINAGESNPIYKATMRSGRGVKFNGTDQSIVADVTYNNSKGTLIFTYTNKADVGSNILIGNSNSGRLFIALNTNKQFDFGLGDISWGSINNTRVVPELGKTYNICLSYNENNAYFYIDGKQVLIANRSGNVPVSAFGIGFYEHGATYYSNSIISNVIYMKDTLEPTEIKYQYTNPEKFLYHEKQTDGTFVAKSKILSQDKIDSVVAHFPMCETDGYVRDMIGYREGSNKIDYANISIDTDGDGVSTLTLLADGFEIEQDGSGTLTDNPSITIPFINAETQVTGNTYIIKYTASLISGTNNAKTQSILGQSIPVVLGTNYYVYTTIEDITSGSFTFDSTVAGKVRIDNIQAQELTSTYPIENFTNAARDDAKNLTTSLQTCLLETDELGVTIDSSFDELTFDGSGYVDTGWTPSGVFQVEEIVVINSIATHYIYDNSGNKYTNGVADGTYPIPIINIILNENTFDNIAGVERRKLFNIHTTPQDPAQLYTDAVKKGLVPEQTQST